MIPIESQAPYSSGLEESGWTTRPGDISHIAGLIPIKDEKKADEYVRSFLEPTHRFDRSYIALELVRVGGRAQEVVGQLPPQLDYTGLEGHFYNIGIPPEEILNEEAKRGKGLLDRDI